MTDRGSFYHSKIKKVFNYFGLICDTDSHTVDNINFFTHPNNKIYYNENFTYDDLFSNILKFINDNTKIFGVSYGDIFANINFKKQLLLLKNKNTSCVLASFKERSPFGHLIINKDYKITKFVEKPIMKKPINIGFYFFKKQIFLNYSFDNKSDLETDFLPMLSKKLQLSSYNHTKVHFTVNTQKDLIDIKKKFLNNKNYFKKL